MLIAFFSSFQSLHLCFSFLLLSLKQEERKKGRETSKGKEAREKKRMMQKREGSKESGEWREEE